MRKKKVNILLIVALAILILTIVLVIGSIIYKNVSSVDTVCKCPLFLTKGF